MLTDTAPQHTYVEVYGVRGRENYEVRKREEQALYCAEGIPVVEWGTVGPLPQLPPRTISTSPSVVSPYPASAG